MAKYCPECGTATEKRIVSALERDACPACDFVQFAKAKIGVGALVFRSKSVLLVERNTPPYGIWTLPSGHQEENETLEAAVLREVWEETGMRILSRGIVFLRNMMEHNAIDIYCVFLCDSDLQEEPIVNDNESTAAQFVPLIGFDELNIEPDSRWFIETYLDLQPEILVAQENPFNHRNLQIYTTGSVL